MGTPSPDWRWPFLAVLLGLTIQKKHELRFAPGMPSPRERKTAAFLILWIPACAGKTVVGSGEPFNL